MKKTKYVVKLNDMKPQMLLKMRISVDSCQIQRYTEEEIMLEFAKDNIKIEACKYAKT